MWLAVLERQFESPYGNFVRAHVGEFTLLSLPEPGDARLVSHILEHRCITSSGGLLTFDALSSECR
jgi:hypothetical protein